MTCRAIRRKTEAIARVHIERGRGIETERTREKHNLVRRDKKREAYREIDRWKAKHREVGRKREKERVRVVLLTRATSIKTER